MEYHSKPPIPFDAMRLRIVNGVTALKDAPISPRRGIWLTDGTCSVLARETYEGSVVFIVSTSHTRWRQRRMLALFEEGLDITLYDNTGLTLNETLGL